MTDLSIKILVSYFKPAPLFDSEVLLPIEAGRSCRGTSTLKDGMLDADDAAWLQEHLNGDDTGDNLSALNREINEWSVIYWAGRNYATALGSPDYIGLMHYSRLLDLGEAQTRDPRVPRTCEEALGLDMATLRDRLPNYDLVTSTGLQLSDLHEHHAPPQPPLPLSESHHPLLYRQCRRYQETRRFYPHNLFIMRRELFLEYAHECLPLLEELLQLGPDERMHGLSDWFRQDPAPDRARRRLRRMRQCHDYYPRFTAYVMELISSYFFTAVMERSPQRVLQVPIFHTMLELRHQLPAWRVRTQQTLVRLLSNSYVSRDRRHRFRDRHSPEAVLLHRQDCEVRRLLLQAALRRRRR